MRGRPALAGAITLVAIVGLALLWYRAASGGGPSTHWADPATIAARVSPDLLGSTLDDLARIAAENAGTRRTGSPGEAATADYLLAQLRAIGSTVAGWHVDEDAFETAVYLDGRADGLELIGPAGPLRTFTVSRDFGALMFSPAGSLEGPIVDLGWDPTATAANGRGCQATDFAGLSPGSVVLTRPAACPRRTVVRNAESAKAGAVVTGYPWSNAGEIRRATLIDPTGISIPAIAVSREVGNALADAARAGGAVRLATSGSSERRTLRSVVAELPGIDRSRVVIVGAHLDSSMDGPGIDDNGTGIAAVLGLARALHGSTPPVTIRFAFWAAEESGLHGSTHYVNGLGSRDGESVVAYLNVDMIGSPNGFPIVYDDAHAAAGSDRIRDLFGADLSAAHVEWKPMDLFGSADHAPFAQAGIPTGGLFSGATEIVTPDDAARFGRTAGVLADRCYHLACDDRDNVDAQLMLTLVRSVARVTVILAGG